MLVELLHEVDVNISIPGLPPSVVAFEPAEFRHSERKGKYVKLVQFPFTLAYPITDYKCQGPTFELVIVDLKKPTMDLRDLGDRTGSDIRRSTPKLPIKCQASQKSDPTRPSSVLNYTSVRTFSRSGQRLAFSRARSSEH